MPTAAADAEREREREMHHRPDSRKWVKKGQAAENGGGNKLRIRGGEEPSKME